MDKLYKILISVINKTIQDKDISINEIGRNIGRSKEDISLSLKGEIYDKSILLETYEFLFPDENDQMYYFIMELVRDYDVDMLKNILTEKYKLQELTMLPSYLLEIIKKDIYRKVMMVETCNTLNEVTK